MQPEKVLFRAQTRCKYTMQALLFSAQADEAAAIAAILQQGGFNVRSVKSLEQAIEAWPERSADLVLITLSERHARLEATLKSLRQMRAHTAVPIIVVCDLIPEDLQVEYIEAGADLFVTRPFGLRWLLAQIRALLRRSTGMPFFSLPTLSQREVHLDPANRSVQVGDQPPQKLTQLEFRLLYTLMTHAGQIIPSEKIVEHVWGYSGEGNRELVRGLVQRLRAKIEPDPSKPKYILTESGIGYYFNRFDE